jgi:hypothetical protein
MSNEFTVGLSNNSALHAMNSYFIASGEEVFLRFHGDWTRPSLMTATAGEHSGRYTSVCADQDRLLFAAALIMEQHGWDWDVKEDNEADRPYIILYSGDSAKNILLLANQFFEVYGQIPPNCNFDISQESDFVRNTYRSLEAKLKNLHRKLENKSRLLRSRENPYIIKIDFSKQLKDASEKQAH